MFEIGPNDEPWLIMPDETIQKFTKDSSSNLYVPTKLSVDYVEAPNPDSGFTITRIN